jgi:hypothetical protein
VSVSKKRTTTFTPETELSANGHEPSSRQTPETMEFLAEIAPDDPTTDTTVEEQPTLLRIRRPSTNEFFQTFPAWNLSVRIYNHKEEGKTGTTYVVSRRMVDHEALPSVVPGIAVLSMTRKNRFFQLVRLPDSSDPHPAHVTMLLAIEASKSEWIRVAWSRPKNEYRRFHGQAPVVAEWAWLGTTADEQVARVNELFRETLLRSGRYIKNEQHPVVKALQDETPDAPELVDPA